MSGATPPRAVPGPRHGRGSLPGDPTRVPRPTVQLLLLERRLQRGPEERCQRRGVLPGFLAAGRDKSRGAVRFRFVLRPGARLPICAFSGRNFRETNGHLAKHGVSGTERGKESGSTGRNTTVRTLWCPCSRYGTGDCFRISRSYSRLHGKGKKIK